ncbi:MAG: type II CRISPR RNA-guided endonuclease Cas9 [Sphaerochaetaceae bacterium]
MSHQKREVSDYYLGLDIGTNSVGWAVTDTDYELLKANKKELWGARLFDAAETAADRRLHRSARRRHQRKLQRLQLLKTIFEQKINETDPQFFTRMKESAYHKEDKSHDSIATLFNDPTYGDAHLHKDFPTFFHLRSHLLYEKETSSDVRLVYLAIHHILKNRGHFLFPGETLNTSDSLDSALEDVKNYLFDLMNYHMSFNNVSNEEIGKILKEKKQTVKRRGLSEILTLSYAGEEEIETSPNTLKSEIIKALTGSPFTLSVLFENESYKESDYNKIELRKDNYEEHKDNVEALLDPEEFQLIEAFEAIYNWTLLSDILKGKNYISDAKISSYDEHKEDLRTLKQLVKTYIPSSYNEAFKDPSKTHNYAHYVGSGTQHGIKVDVKHKSKCSQEEVNKYFENLLKHVVNDDDSSLSNMKERLSLKEALPKQRIRDNRTIPTQLHKTELKTILDNANQHHPFLSIPDEDGYTPTEKILSMMSFRVPYYVGPLNTYHMEEEGMEGFAWMVRQKGEENTRILPWNWERVVDQHASAENFINRMTNSCTYLYSESVLPKNSLLYTKYMVLNELNNVKIHGELIPVDLKKQIYQELFLDSGRKTITLAMLKNYLVVNNIINKTDKEHVTGVDITFTSSLKSHIDFYEPFLKPGILTEKEVEDIIEWKAFYVDDAKILEEKISAELGNKLTAQQIKEILKIVRSYKGWGRLSKALLTEIYDEDPTTGEAKSIIKAMWDSNNNLMELLSDRFTYLSQIQEINRESISDKAFSYESLVKPLPVSPPVKRQIWQTLLVVKELRKIQGKAPKRIFIEMAREEGIKKRTTSRKESLQKLYESCKNDLDFNKGLIASLEEKSPAQLRRDELYFYYTQLGKCPYCGESINLQRMGDYDIDHIYPQSLIKDDSLDNRVLVHKTCNGKKGDQYPLPYELRAKMGGFWGVLVSKGLISKEKYYRLTRSTELNEEELAAFINRQIVETRQSSKHIANILKQIFGDDQLITYVKARNVVEFRNDFELKKSRLVNDHHHAHDAYLNIVVGNTYHTQYTESPLNFVRQWRGKNFRFNPSKLFENTVERNGLVAWVKDDNYSNNKGKSKQDKRESGTILTVRKTLKNPRVLVTRQVVEKTGELFNLQPIRAKNGLIPLKGSPANFHDTAKYGGYEAPSTAYFSIVEYTKKNKRLKRIVAIPIMYAEKFTTDHNALIRYCVESFNLLDPRIVMPKILVFEAIRTKGYEIRLSGMTEPQVFGRNNIQLILDESDYDYIVQTEKFVSFIQKQRQSSSNTNQDFREIAESFSVSLDKNIEMYEVLLAKERDTIFRRRPANQAGFLESKREEFAELDLTEQGAVILQLINLFSCSSVTANLKLLGGGASVGSIKYASVLDENTFLIHYSPTGVFSKTIKVDDL